jgi:hypothetical protein
MFKKLIVTVVILATATTAMARDITVSFADGSNHQYNNTPNSVTPEQIQARVAQDFPHKQLVNIDGGRKQHHEEEVGFWDSGWGTAIKVVVFGAILYKLSTPLIATSGCDFDWQRAKDGSRCGGRSAASRPGGK